MLVEPVLEGFPEAPPVDDEMFPEEPPVDDEMFPEEPVDDDGTGVTMGHDGTLAE